MTGFLATRRRVEEQMDAPDADPRLLHKSLAYIRWINRVLGYQRLVIQQLERFSQKWDPRQSIRILDVGTGSADIPRAILSWAVKKRFDLRVVGIDLHSQAVREAAGPEERLTIVRGDALKLPFADGSFDYAITSMFLHHLDDGDVVRTLREMDRVSRRGIIASDLLRRRHAWWFIRIFSLLANPMVRHDGPASVAQSFTPDEIRRLRDEAGVSYAEYSEHMTHRYILAGERKQ